MLPHSPVPLDVRPILQIDEARAMALGPDGLPIFGRTAFYDALKAGTVPGLRRVGRRCFVCASEYRTWLGLEQ